MCLPWAVLLEAISGVDPESSFTGVVWRCLGDKPMPGNSTINKAYE
jgi:hypothetical protein